MLRFPTIPHRALVRAILLVAWIATAASCVDHRYDFNRTDRSVNLTGQTIAIPLGQTGPLTAEALFGEKVSEYLAPQSDGSYALQYTAKPVNISLDELRKIDGAAPFSRFCDLPLNYDFSLFAKPGNPAFDAQGEADLSGSLPRKIQFESVSRSISTVVPNIPKEICGLKSITLSKNSRIELALSIPDCLLAGGTVTPDLRLDLSSIFESDDFPDGVIKINTPLDSKNGYTANITIPLQRFALKPNSFNAADHSLNVNAAFKFDGSCTISQPRTDRPRYDKSPKENQLHVTIIMRDIAIQEVEGSFDYSRTSQVTFTLGDFSSRLSETFNGDVTFDFDDPAILLDIESNITIPISAKLDLSARQNRVTYAQVKGIPVELPLAQPGSSASKRLRMSKNPAQVPGEEAIRADFSQLLSRIPDDMLISAQVATMSNKTAVLRLGETYRISLTPQVIIPLNLGPATRIALRDTLDMPEKLGELLNGNTFQVVGSISNGFPLDLSISLVMIDADGTPLTDTVSQVLAAGSTSDVALTLAKLPGADTGRLTSAVLSFEVNGTAERRSIRTDDTIEARLSLLVPGGFHYTF